MSRWTNEDDRLLTAAINTGGYAAARAAFPARSKASIYKRAERISLSTRCKQRNPYSAEEDERIRRAYEGGLNYGGLLLLARQLGRSYRSVAQRAVRLGLSRRIRPQTDWNPTERAILRRTAHLTVAGAAQALAAAGYRRPRAAIMVGRKMLHLDRTTLDRMSLSDTAAMLGISTNTVRKAIRQRELRALDSKGEYDRWSISLKEIRHFVRRHPTRIDLRRVDPIWQPLLLEVLIGSPVGQVEGRAAA